MTHYTTRYLGASAVGSTLLLASCSLIAMLPELDPTIRGSGVIAEESRTVRNVSGVELGTLGTVYVTQGEREELRIEAEENLLPHLRTRVEGRVLRIDTPESVSLRPTLPVRFHLTVRDLDRVVLSGSGSLEAENLRARRLAATVNGSGTANLTGLTAEALTAAISGSGGLNAAGRVTTTDINISGSGPVDARDLESARASVNISGSGSATLRVRDRLDATISGSGSVRYYGNPRVSQNVTGSGRVVRAGG